MEAKTKSNVNANQVPKKKKPLKPSKLGKQDKLFIALATCVGAGTAAVVYLTLKRVAGAKPEKRAEMMRRARRAFHPDILTILDRMSRSNVEGRDALKAHFAQEASPESDAVN